MDAQILYALVMMAFLLAIPLFWLLVIKLIAKIFAKEIVKQLKKQNLI